MPIKQLFTASYQVRLDNHSPTGDFTASVRHSGVQEAAFGDAHLFLRQHVIYGRNAAEIVVFLLVDKMHVDYFRHGYIALYSLQIYQIIIIWNNKGAYFSQSPKQTAHFPAFQNPRRPFCRHAKEKATAGLICARVAE